VRILATTSLEAAINASDLVSAGTLQIVVVNPPPNGGASSAFPLNVTNAVPSISSLSPVSAQAGGASTTLSVSGTGYVPNSVVMINGAPRTTIFAGSTGIQATLTVADLAAGGIDQVQVFNPAPGGGTSNTQTFAVDPTDTAGLPILVDIAPSGAQANNGICGASCSATPTLATAGPSVSTSGEFVLFASNSTNLLSTVTQPNLTNGASNIFLRDTCLGSTTSTCATPTTILVGTSASGGAADGPNFEPSLDSAGTNVAFTSTASNLVNYVTVPGGTRQVYWQTPCTSATASSCTTTNAPVLVSLSADGTSAGNGDSYNPMISPDGQYVAFVSLATNLVSGLTGLDGVTPQVYIRTICAGVTPLTQNPTCIPTTFLVSSADGVTPANGASSNPAVSNTGLFVSFVSTATNLGATAPNGGAAQEPVRRRGHPPHPHRDQPLQPALMRLDDQPYRIGTAAIGGPFPQRAPRNLAPQFPAYPVPVAPRRRPPPQRGEGVTVSRGQHDMATGGIHGTVLSRHALHGFLTGSACCWPLADRARRCPVRRHPGIAAPAPAGTGPRAG